LAEFLEEQNEEVKGATLLYTLAGLMITFAGFSALLLAVRPAAGAGLSLLGKERVLRFWDSGGQCRRIG
jgi:hypothetical protein